jgi:hypothetical protein
MRNSDAGESGRRRNWPRLALRAALVSAAFLVAGLVTRTRPATVASARPLSGIGRDEQKHETREVTGLVTDVRPQQITLQSKDGATLILATFEDYGDRVAVGSQVTASYYPQDAGKAVLKSLDYPPETLFVPVGEITRRVHRVILLPNSQVPDADALYDDIREYLHGTFGWYVAPSYLTDEVRKRAQQSHSMLDAMDSRTGNFDMSGYLSKTESVIPKVAAESRSDAVLELHVIQVQAPVARMVASWDGMDEPVTGGAMRALAKISMFPHRGEVTASTVELKLWDAKGTLLWRKRRGLALLEVLRGKGNRLEERPLSEALSDTERTQHWMQATFNLIGPQALSASSR